LLANAIDTNYRGGNLWASWYAYVTFFRDLCGWENPSLAGFAHDERAALNASCVFYHHDVAAIADRPCTLLRNSRGALHCESGPALAYRDGWQLWRIDGIEVDEQIVMRPESQKVAEIDGEQNADRRSIRLARFGWPRYLKETGAACIHERKNDVEGTREALFQSRDGSRRLVATCPTGRVFVMGCPPEVQTCEQAQNYLAGQPIDKQSRVLFRT
jgi:hypothetical protein